MGGDCKAEMQTYTFSAFSVILHHIKASNLKIEILVGIMKLDFYYYSYQCPLNDDMIRLLDEYKDKIDICYHDVVNDFQLAKELKMFFPTLVVLNSKKRYYSPLRRTFLEQVAAEKYPEEKPYLPPLSKKVVTKYVEPLNGNNVGLACNCCGNGTQSNRCKKAQFLKMNLAEPYGFIHKNETGCLIGGAEYLPAKIVPYNIPHDSKTAFITCVYMSDSEYDYKTAPLQALEHYLCGQYTRAIAIADEKGVFPNGDLCFFIRNGYRDEGVIFKDAGYCSLHLVSKQLVP